MRAADPDDLAAQLSDGGFLSPLPKEPAALANVIEVSIVDFLVQRLEADYASYTRGSERGYPDIEIGGALFGGGYHAVDIKAAQRSVPKTPGRVPTRTQSRITLYTGNTYFKFPGLHWPGTLRAFDEYQTHLDVIVLYTLDVDAAHRVQNVEVLIHEPWRIASKQRSSTTREYIGAVDSIERLRRGEGEFSTADEFYRFWRTYPFKISAQVQKQLTRLTEAQAKELAALRANAREQER